MRTVIEDLEDEENLKRQNKLIYPVMTSGYDKNWPSAKPDEFFKWFQDKLALVPEEYRESARIEIDSTTGGENDGSSNPEINISYLRPETDLEMESRITRYKESIKRREEQEIELYKRYKDKYGDIV
jgi:hypothetical protein